MRRATLFLLIALAVTPLASVGPAVRVGADGPPALAAEPKAAAPSAGISVPAEVSVRPGRLARIVVTTDSKAAVKVVNLWDETDLFREYDPSAVVFRFLADRPGRYKIGFYTAAGGEPTDPAYCVVVVGDGPAPPGPGPGPGPGPTPPGPTPPGPAPIPEPGLRVLIVYESAELSKLPKEQFAALYGQALNQYLQDKCVAEAGGSKGWRIWDKDVDTKNAGKLWQDAMRRQRTSLPWIVISDGKAGFEGPLPANEADLLALLKRFGG